MISFEKRDSNSSEILNIQGMDIYFILKNYPLDTLKDNLPAELLQLFKKIQDQINKAEPVARESALRKSYPLDISLWGNKIRDFIKMLVEQNVLFERKKLLSISQESLGSSIGKWESETTDSYSPYSNNPHAEYFLNSYIFAKYVSDNLKRCNYIVGILDSGLANTKKATNELRKIKNQLEKEGYHFQDGNGKPKKILFVCDIMGTIDRADEEQLEEVARLLGLLKEKHGSDGIIFSLMTGDSSAGYLTGHFERIKPFLEDNGIEIGRQFYQSAYYDGYEEEFTSYTRSHHMGSKFGKMVDYSAELKETTDLTHIYCVDDNPIYYSPDMDEELGDTYYHFLAIGVGAVHMQENNTATTARNIKGVLDVLNFQVDPNEYGRVKELVMRPPAPVVEEDDDGDLPF